MSNRNRWIMLVVIFLAVVAIAIDYVRHPVLETTADDLNHIADEHEEGVPCSMDGQHAG